MEEIEISETCFVLFESKNADLESAMQALLNYKFTVKHDETKLLCSRGNSQEFTVYYVEQDSVLQEAIEIGQGTDYETALKLCNARFELSIDNLDEALDEINTLMELQGALQDVSNGYLFTLWNGNLLEPQA